MEKELCLKFLVHLHKFSSSVLQKDEAHEHRKAKVLEFKDKVKKVIALIEFA